MQIHWTQVNPSYFIFLHHELLKDATYMQLQQMHINIFLSSLLRILFYYTKITPPVRQHQRGSS